MCLNLVCSVRDSSFSMTASLLYSPPSRQHTTCGSGGGRGEGPGPAHVGRRGSAPDRSPRPGTRQRCGGRENHWGCTHGLTQRRIAHSACAPLDGVHLVLVRLLAGRMLLGRAQVLALERFGAAVGAHGSRKCAGVRGLDCPPLCPHFRRHARWRGYSPANRAGGCRCSAGRRRWRSRGRRGGRAGTRPARLAGGRGASLL